MGIPILNQIKQELDRIYVAGSPLAKDDPRLTECIPPLQTLGEKSPVFEALAQRLDELAKGINASGDETSSPESLLEVGQLLYSILYTQGETVRGAQWQDFSYSSQPLRLRQTPHSTLSEGIELLTSASQAQDKRLDAIYQSGLYRDPRLYAAYCEAITENHTYISDYVETTIIPAVGENMIPFLREAVDIGGGKRDARLFRLLYALQGKEILSLSEKVLQEGTPELLPEAIYTLGEDPAYEETLLAYAGDRKTAIRQAAFVALVRMDSDRGQELLQEKLSGASIASIKPLLEALALTKRPEIVKAAHDELNSCLDDMEKNKSKISVLMQVLARRDEDEGLFWLEWHLADKYFYEKAAGTLNVTELMQLLTDLNTPRKNKVLYNIASNNPALRMYKIIASTRMFSSEEVYARCRQDMREQTSLGHTLLHAYGAGAEIPDAQKNWDRRWAKLFLDNNNIHLALAFIYDDDERTWRYLLDACVNQIAKSSYKQPYYANIWARAHQNKHPKAERYYQKFLKAKYPAELLDKVREQEL